MTPPQPDPSALQSSQASSATPPVSPPALTEFPREQRYVFVGFLFSLVVAEVARLSADLYLQHRGFFGEALCAYCHLLLATVVTTTSWVGWTLSEASRSERMKVQAVFSGAFFVFLIDVLLVVFYFILVRSAEIPGKADASVTPSAHEECKIISAIFFIYFIWDILTKAVIVEKGVAASTPFLQRMKSKDCWSRAGYSLLCFVISLATYVTLESAQSSRSVIFADLSLLCLVLLFRALKQKDASPIWWIVAVLFGGTFWLAAVSYK